VQVFFVLRFGTDEGEGGTFALFHGIYPPKVIDYGDERALVTDFTRKACSSTSSVETLLSKAKWILLAWVSRFAHQFLPFDISIPDLYGD
jgi:KUP system potassium uptake protein